MAGEGPTKPEEESPTSAGTVWIDAGAGNDVVDTTAADGRPAWVTLGAGSDRFEGGAGQEKISGGVGEALFDQHQDTEPDVILSGGGVDWVDSGTPGVANADVVDLGGGDDDLRYDGTWAPGGSITGAGGTDFIGLTVTGESAVVDNDAGRFVDQGRTMARFTDLEYFYVEPTGAPPRELTFVGGSADETLLYYGDSRLTARFGAGNDTLDALPGNGSDLDGGPGKDLLDVTAHNLDPISLDLRSGSLLRPREGAYAAALTGFEDASLLGSRVALRGTDGANRLKAAACTGSVHARGGDDTATLPDKNHVMAGLCEERLVRLRGGAGDDRLVGSSHDDLVHGDAGDDTIIGNFGHDRLVGGSGDDRLLGRTGRDVLVGAAGQDTARGGPGADRCSAEVRLECER